MKKILLLFPILLFALTACSGYYTEDEVMAIRDSYKEEVSQLNEYIDDLERDVSDAYDEGLAAGYNSGYDDGHSGAYDEGYDDGHSVGYESGYDDGSAEGYDEGFDDGRSQGWNNAVQHYRAWILDSEYADLWGELYNALSAFWSGDTSDLSAFEDGLYDVILDIYGEYKVDKDPDTPKDPDPPADDPVDPPEPPEDPPPPTYTVYITEFGEKYHSYGCQYLKDSCYAIDKNSAIAKGYTACSRCKP